MRADDLLKPVAADMPCGEDLLAADDPDFVDYYFNVEDRFPTSYFNILRNELFDPRSVDLKGETAQIDLLLARSRDLRLVVIQAKFQILCGRFRDFSNSLDAVAGMLEAWPAEVHPTDSIDRRNALEELNALPTITAPLEYAPLITDRRLGDILYRGYATGSGKITPREGEVAGDATGITGALGSSDNAKAVDTLYAQLTTAQEALRRIAAVTRAGPDPFSPTLTRLTEKLQDIAMMVGIARTDLGGAPAETSSDETGISPAAPAEGATSVIVQTSVAGVSDHRDAYRLLVATEAYFARNEPASLALVLVTQSRLLIGRPLVDALDALLPNNASSAVISFGTSDGFGIYMNRMREISEHSGLSDNSSFAEEREDDPPAIEVVSREHAGQIIKQVEDFFRLREPASPIPILLFKARNMLSKDFNDLVRELIASREY